MAKASKTAKKAKSKKADVVPVTSAAVNAPIEDGEKINPVTKWAPLLGLPIGAICACEIWDWRGGVKWMLALSLFIVGWRFMLQVSRPQDKGAAS